MRSYAQVFTLGLALLLAAAGAALVTSGARAATTSGQEATPAGNCAEPAPPFALESWTTEHGLPQNSVTALLQTRAGYIWAATYNGIAQFDGVRFTVFDSSSAEGLPNSRITSLFEDGQGTIWIGHDTGEITCFSKGVFRPLPLRAPWGGGTIQGMGTDARGEVWAINLRGEALRVGDGLVLKPPPEMAAQPSLMAQLSTDGRHHLLLVRNGRVAELRGSAYDSVSFASQVQAPHYAGIAAARKGGWWVAGEGRIRRWAEGKWQEDLGPFPWEPGFLTTMMESSSGQLLAGTLERGLFICEREGRWIHLTRSNGLPQDWIRCLHEDREHNIWAGTSGGLVVLRPRQVAVLSPPDAWQGRPVQAIHRAQDGTVWASTEGAGLYCLKGSAWRHFDASVGLSNLFVWSVLEDSQKNLWVGTWGGGLFRLQENRLAPQFDLAELGEPVTALLESPPGTLWIGTAAGLMRWADHKLERLAGLGGAAAGDVRALEAGSNGEIWVGSQGSGLGRLRDGQLRSFHRREGLPREFILSLHQDVDGTLWIGTLDRGLVRFRSGRFDSLTTEHGLPNNVIGHIEDDQLGNLWFSSQRGLFRVSKSDLNACADGRTAALRPLVFGKAEGMTAPTGSSGFTPSGFRAPDGRLWFPTAHGIAVVNPRAVRRNEVPPSVWVEEMLVEGQRAAMHTAAAPAEEASVPAGSSRTARWVELRPGQRHLDILFTGISFISPERVQFKYRLEGLDAEWTDGGTRRRITYPFLPPGRYRFRLQACNSDGLWNEAGDAVGIVVQPYLWQTWWFKGAVALAGLASVGGGVYWESRRRTRVKLERLAREHEMERERARIAQDIHDDLGASLTRISMLSQSAAADLHDPPRAAVELNHIYETARELTRAMDEIVWAVNPRHDTLESLTNYVTRFAHDFLSAAHIRCRLDAPVQLPELTVRSEIRHNLFLAFKETLNNAVKHSGASEARISLEVLPMGLKLGVEDNGAGFEPGKAGPTRAANRLVSGYGMAGIHTRLEQLGGKVEVHSRPGAGTRVELLVPLPAMESRPSAGASQAR